MKKILKPYKQVIEERLSYKKYHSIVNPMIKNFGKEVELTLLNHRYFDSNGYLYQKEWFE